MDFKNIKVSEIKFLNNGGNLRAFVSVQLDEWTIHDFRIVKKDGERAWVSSPQLSWKDHQDGQIKYKALLTIPGEARQRIETAILSAWEKEKNGSHSA